MAERQSERKGASVFSALSGDPLLAPLNGGSDVEVGEREQRRTKMCPKFSFLLWTVSSFTILALVILVSYWSRGSSTGLKSKMITLTLKGDEPGRAIPSTLFGVFFEEINHAGSGGLWAELVSNRGFESGGQSTPSLIEPWYAKGDTSDVILSTERVSLFERNPIALRVTTLCGSESHPCPDGGVGAVNPGYWGIDVRAGKRYTITFWLRSDTSVKLFIRFISEDEKRILAEEILQMDADACEDWLKYTFELEAFDTDHSGKLALTTSVRGSIWLDQVSAFPEETYKNHGFRTELAQMLEDLRPAFLRFPGGCYVEGVQLANAWRWRDTVGPWEKRPGHFGDVWSAWSDDGLGFFEYLQLAEDLEAAPVWVFNNGISHQSSVDPHLIQPWVKDILDGIEFARGPNTSLWGSVRAAMGHSDPFPLQYVAVGNEDCWKPWYRENYLAFYEAIKAVYPDMKIISNCDATNGPLNHPADLYDYHIYTNAESMFRMTHVFDQKSRETGPKVFVSEYAVTGRDSGTGSLLAAIAEAAFLIGVELNSDVVEMASYAPLFVRDKDRRWNPDAIVFNSWQQYGTPSYWVQWLFKHSNGARLLPFEVTGNQGSNAVVSVIRRHDEHLNDDFLVIKAVNFDKDSISMRVKFDDYEIMFPNSTVSVLSSKNVTDENSFAEPRKVVPQVDKLADAGTEMLLMTLPGHTVVVLDVLFRRRDAF